MKIEIDITPTVIRLPQREFVEPVIWEIEDSFRPWWCIGNEPQQILQKLIQRINDEGAYIVGRYTNASEIEIGPFKDWISIYNAPYDILPFIPLFFREIDMHGTYTVMRGLKMLGCVTYQGMPKQNKANTLIAGVKTKFVLKEEMEGQE